MEKKIVAAIIVVVATVIGTAFRIFQKKKMVQ